MYIHIRMYTLIHMLLSMYVHTHVHTDTHATEHVHISAQINIICMYASELTLVANEGQSRY